MRKNELPNCPHCGASAILIAPKWFNRITGYVVRGIGKQCPQTREHKTSGPAKREWVALANEKEVTNG